VTKLRSPATGIERIVLIGLPGSGKSTVGAELAKKLHWQFIDFDDEIVARCGKSVARVFREDGESAFRAMELRLTVELSSRSHVVLAPGGGWAAQPGLLENLPHDSRTVWLRVAAAEAMRRLRGSPLERPLLMGEDPLAKLESLAQQREERYARADLTLDVDGRDVAEIVDDICTWLKRSIS
jgi:shikimate kinase